MSMNGKIIQKIATVFFSSLLFLSAVNPAFATLAPDFPNCPNPVGTVIASYEDGVHGIAGSTLTYTGSDTVYQIDTNRVSQCYCSPDGSGIQTNWWKASSLTPKQKTELVDAGWIYIPDGSVWGLDPSDWMAYNISFVCGGKGGGSSSSESGSSSSSSSNSSSSSSNSIVNIIPQILGFADTGRLAFWRQFFFLTGIVSFAAGFLVLFVRSIPRQPKKR